MGTVTLPTRSRIRVRLEHAPVGSEGRAFCDPDTKLLEYHIIPHAPYRTFIHAGPVRIDCDVRGFPVMAVCDYSTLDVQLVGTHRPPLLSEVAYPRFLDGPSRIQENGLRVISDGRNFHIQMSPSDVASRVKMADGAIWEVDHSSNLVGLWILDPCIDPYGRWRPSWRAATWRRMRRNDRQYCENLGSGRLSPISVGTTS